MENTNVAEKAPEVSDVKEPAAAPTAPQASATDAPQGTDAEFAAAESILRLHGLESRVTEIERKLAHHGINGPA